MRGPNGLITAAPTARTIHQVGTHGKMETLIVLGATALITQRSSPSLTTRSLFFISFALFTFPFPSFKLLVCLGNDEIVKAQ